MAYARYPQLRNYKKRCEIETKIEALKDQRSAYEKDNDAKWDAAFARGASAAEMDNIELAYNEHVDNIDAEIEALRRMQVSLEYPQTKNAWLVKVVCSLGVGVHHITARQYDCMVQYCERDTNDHRNNVACCRVGNYFLQLGNTAGGKYAQIEILPERLNTPPAACAAGTT